MRSGKRRIIAALIVAALAVSLFGGCAKTAQSFIEQGDKYLSAYNYDKAMDKYNEALKLEEDNVDAYRGLAKALLGRNEYERAADIYIQLGDEGEAARVYEAHEDINKATELYHEDFLLTGSQTSFDKYLEYTDYEVTFVDSVVEGFVREYLDKPEGAIMRNELNDITGVRIYGDDYLFSTPSTEAKEKTDLYDNYAGNKRSGVGSIEHLDDFIHFANLEYLLVYYNSISDVDVKLAAHEKLDQLYLSYNYISDLTEISELTNITKLSLTGNSIKNLEPISNMTQLTLLYLQKNNISDLTPLSGLTNLQKLLLSQNSITDVTPLANLTGLTDLFLDNNRYLKDIRCLDTLVNMERLTLGKTLVKDYSALSGMTNLEFDYVDLRTI